MNGTKHFHANNFIFTGNVRDLNVLMPDEFMGHRAKAKLKKDTAWIGLCLDLFHEVPEGTAIVEKDNLFILNGTTDDDIGPCVGRFHPALTPQKQISQWMSFVDVDTAEETENIAEVLKKMKRQIKRAFLKWSNTSKANVYLCPRHCLVAKLK